MTVAKSRKQILQELLDLEDSKVEELQPTPSEEIISEPENTDCITRAKKSRTPKQIDAFERAKAIRDANTAKRKEDAALKAEEERKIIEEKLIKKAIALKKKQIKKQAVLDEVSDDETPIEKIKEIALKQSLPSLGASVKSAPIADKPLPLARFTFF